MSNVIYLSHYDSCLFPWVGTSWLNQCLLCSGPYLVFAAGVVFGLGYMISPLLYGCYRPTWVVPLCLSVVSLCVCVVYPLFQACMVHSRFCCQGSAGCQMSFIFWVYIICLQLQMHLTFLHLSGTRVSDYFVFLGCMLQFSLVFLITTAVYYVALLILCMPSVSCAPFLQFFKP